MFFEMSNDDLEYRIKLYTQWVDEEPDDADTAAILEAFKTEMTRRTTW